MGRFQPRRGARNTLVLGTLAVVLAGCGGSDDGRAIFAHAEDGLTRIRGGTIELHLTVHALVPIERSATLRVDDVPLAKVGLTRWTKHPRRVACRRGLDCARADLDVEAALRDLDALLPSLPVDVDSVRSATIEVAVTDRGHLTRRLSLHGELDPGGMMPGSVPFDVDLEVERP